MIVPLAEPNRSEKVAWVVDHCLSSQRDRAQMYETRRQYFLFGTDATARTLYNRLNAHLDLVASFLYAADHARYTVAAPRNASKLIVQMMAAVEDEWNDVFRDSGIAYQFGQALLWSLVYDSMFLKVGWTGIHGDDEKSGDLFCRIVEPHQIGVFDESEPDLDSQEAFVHSYYLNWDNAVLRLVRAGLRDRIKDLAPEVEEGATDMPAPLRALIVSANAGNALTGNLIGSVNQNYEMQPLYRSRSTVPKVQFNELYFWDDIVDDYVCITLIGNNIVLSDSRETMMAYQRAARRPSAVKKKLGKRAEKEKFELRYASSTNVYLPGEHPFVQITPFKVYNYMWGKAHCDDLMALQDWSADTLNNIMEILKQQVDPAKVFSGFSGLSDEKAGALGGPGSWVLDQLPGAKVDRLIPEMPPDLFANFNSIGHVFLEASGLTETVSGKGEQGVRGKAHAKQLATTGSGRIRKIAVGLEDPLTRLGDLCLRLKQKNDPTELETATKGDQPGMSFVLAQLPVPWKMRIAGHSHSPLFSDEARELAVLLLKAKAIDREMFVKMMSPPSEAAILHQLKESMQIEQAQLLARQMQPHTAPKPKLAA